MQFSEKQLGELFEDTISSDGWSEYLPIKNIHKLQIDLLREYNVGDGTRADFVVKCDNRLLWVIEYKIVAEPNSIIQAYDYFKKILNANKKTKIGIGKITVAAQFFKDDTIFFAEKLGVELIQIAPINFKEAKLNVISRKDFIKLTTKPWVDCFGFERIGLVLNG